MNLNEVAAAGAALVIDDDPVIQALMGGILKTIGLPIISAMSGDEGLAKAREKQIQVILLDNEMPGVSGMEVLRRLKAEPETAAIPVIMCTGVESNRVLSECFALGAIDYLRKPFASVELRARVNAVLERQRLLAELTQAARYDRLTGLANRTLLSDRLTRAVARVKANPGAGFAVMFLDFDRFKLVNDTLGHDVGDLLLQAIARRLLHNLRATDEATRDTGSTTVARLGGDEFVLLLEGVNSVSDAEHVANRLLTALDRPYQLGSSTVRSTASIGTVLSATHYELADDMLRDADIAMYEAKARGKACHVVFNDSMRNIVHERVAMENALHASMGTPELFLVFQPIFALETSVPCGIEALMRWTHPELGPIAPEVFVPVAEEGGFMLPLNAWVLADACRMFTQLQRECVAGYRTAPRYVSVNISRLQFADTHFVENILHAVRQAGMTPDQLQIEFTEQQVEQHRTLAQPLLRELRSHGVRLAMDNFGSGHSSLLCLQEFSLDCVKIDRALIANASTRREFAALLHAVITLAENLDLEVIAEGVETSNQLVLLQALGCPYAEGFLLAPPLDAEATSLFFAREAVMPVTMAVVR
ncbi:MAG: EAL domain-containing protein [Phycisphaerae bacterium]|nr:EAL domain-containing protein [Gemmatimonadaceae bacterium]